MSSDMNLWWILVLAGIFLGDLSADEVVQPPLLPSAMLLPLGVNLVDKDQQQRDANTLKNVANVLEQALDKRGSELSKGKAAQSVAKETKSVSKDGQLSKLDKQEKRSNTEGLLHAATTEFLRAPEFSRPVTIKVKNIAVRDALLILSKQAGINFLIDNDVQESMPHLNADRLPIGAVVQMVLDAHKPPLALVRISGAWRVVLRSRADELIRSILQAESAYDRIVDYIHVKQAVWDDRFKSTAQELWRGIVGDTKDKYQTYLVFDDTANQLIVCARGVQVKKFKELIHSIDRAAPQVRLEMRVICAGKNFESDFGLQWSGLYDRRYWAGKFGLAGLGIGSTQAPSGLGVAGAGSLPPLNPINPGDTFKNLLGWVLNAIPVNLATKTAAQTAMSFPITFGGRNLEWGRLNLQLMAAEQNSEIKTILKPVLLVNNQDTAEILVGQQLPHSVKIEESVKGNVVNASSTAYKDVGTKIQVKPATMVKAGQVVLDIFLEHTYVTNLQQSGVKDDRGTYSYSIETARTRNKVVLKSGQTTMIGGLMVNTYEQAESGIPFLKDIPVLGWLFRGRSKVLVDKQLLIFITPTLIDSVDTAALIAAADNKYLSESV
jgi:type II secretory pathway component GspD/PulD (secretin)